MKRLPSQLASTLLVTTIFASVQMVHADEIELLSVGPQAVSIPGTSNNPDVTPDGRFVAFSTSAKLASGDSNGTFDILRLDRQTGDLVRVSVASSGEEADNLSTRPSISDDGKRIAFESTATNLSSADNDGKLDVYLHDLGTGETLLISKDTNGNAADGFSFDAAISGNGRYVAFTSTSSKLISNDTNGFEDVFVYDTQQDVLQRASESALGVGGDSSSGGSAMGFSGNVVMFESSASNLVPGFGSTRLIYSRSVLLPSISVVSLTFTGLEPNGPCGNVSVNAANSIVAFDSDATNMVVDDNNGRTDVFVRYSSPDLTRLVSESTFGFQGNEDSYEPTISPEGDFVAFVSDATNLAGPDTNGQPDIFRRSLTFNQTVRASLTVSGDPTNGASWEPVMSADGRDVLYASEADNITTNDANGGNDDVFSTGIDPPVVIYCDNKISSLGCSPVVSAFGAASLGSGSPNYVVQGRNINVQKAGLFFYSPLGRAAIPFFGGTLCVQPPLQRTPIAFSGGAISLGPCSGNFFFNLNNYLQSGNDPFTQAGDVIAGQFWFRDPDQADGTGVGLTNGIEIFICP